MAAKANTGLNQLEIIMKALKEMHHVGVNLPSSLYDLITQYQGRTGYSRSDVVRTALIAMFGVAEANSAVPNQCVTNSAGTHQQPK